MTGSKIQINKKIQKYNQSFTFDKNGKSVDFIDVEPDYGGNVTLNNLHPYQSDSP